MSPIQLETKKTNNIIYLGHTRFLGDELYCWIALEI